MRAAGSPGRRPEERIYVSNAHIDVSYGALRLLNPALKPASTLTPVRPLGVSLEVSLEAYRDQWRRDVEQVEAHA